MGTFVTDPTADVTANGVAPASLEVREALRDLRDQSSGWWNVKSLGATGDGATDDAAAIQAVLGAIPSTGGTVVFPQGTYIIRSTLSLPQLDGPLVLKGLGQPMLWNAQVGASLHTLEAGWPVQAVHALVIEDLAFNADAASGAGLKGVNVNGLIVNRCKFYNNGSHGVQLDYSYAVRIRDSLFHQNAGHGVALFNGSGNDCQVAGCRFLSNGSIATSGAGVYVNGGAASLKVDHCDFESNYIPVSLAGPVWSAVVRDCYFENGGTPTSQSALLISGACRAVVFDGNYVQDIATEFANAAGITVSNNAWNNASPTVGAGISNLIAFNNAAEGTTTLPVGWGTGVTTIP